MAVDIKFDAHQPYQREAIDAVLDLFTGQESAEQGFTSAHLSDEGMLTQEVVFGNTLALSPAAIEGNLRTVQERNLGPAPAEPDPEPDPDQVLVVDPLRPPVERRPLTDELDFSLEMETGTGKTYVYLRTIAELHRRYGWAKYVIVVPSVAIREGVLSSLGLLKNHIRDLYDGLQFDHAVWDSKFPTRVHQFATASHLQILVVNIDSFTKESNIMRKVDPDRLNGYAPIQYLCACRPIVIMDEPQNMETEIRQAAIASLEPLFRLRYSATHRDLKHLVYRLTPVDAYDQRLVKQIGVLSVTKDADLGDAYVEVSKITGRKGSVTATVKIHKATKAGTRLTQVTLHKDDDLEMLSGRPIYHGWLVEDIHTAVDGHRGYVEFANGRRVKEGRGTSDEAEEHQRLMLRQTVLAHFEKELQLATQRMRGTIPDSLKPLTLFFIDRVANYAPADGKFRAWFEAEYEALRTDGRFQDLDLPDVSVVHDGYFAVTGKGEAKDSTIDAAGITRDTKETAAAFERIMRNKEALLSFDEPLRFIFSHSALAEGWDNPNVFTICNLQEGKSQMRKRQQIGRGLRLPVMANGERCRVEDINMVTVIAKEEFARFADGLQKEIEADTGIRFPGRIVDVRKKTPLQLKERVLADPVFLELWGRISQRTTFEVDLDTNRVVAEAVKRINDNAPVEAVKFRIEKGTVGQGMAAGSVLDGGTVDIGKAVRVPDLVGEVTSRVTLSRATVVRILKSIDNLEQVRVNPSVFIDRVVDAINRAVYLEVSDGIVYRPIADDAWSAELFRTRRQDWTYAPESMVIGVTKSVTDKVVCDSMVEAEFARFLESRADVPLFLKLPGWFKIDTPLGGYNPDWALVRRRNGRDEVVFVRETKGTDELAKLQWESEAWKIKYGMAHFKALEVDFDFGSDPETLIEPSAIETRTAELLRDLES